MKHNLSALILPVVVESGSTIEAAFEQCVILANDRKMKVSFKFNSVECVAYPGTFWKDGVTNYNQANKSKEKFKYANSLNPYLNGHNQS